MIQATKWLTLVVREILVFDFKWLELSLEGVRFVEIKNLGYEKDYGCGDVHIVLFEC